MLQQVDHSAMRTNQAVFLTLLIVAFIFNLNWLVVFVALVLIYGVIRRQPGFKVVYAHLFRPLGLQPELLDDNPEPHRFAQGIAAFLSLMSIPFLFVGLGVVGWVLVWLVILAACINLFLGFCIGCAIYYWLGRASVRGFSKRPPPNTFPGRRVRVV